MFYLLCSIALALACVYLFQMNHLGMQGYILSKVTEKNAEITNTLQKIDAQITRLETREYVSKLSEQDAMVVRQQNQYIVMKQTFTAQK
ncbi:hypothetical protein K9L27_00690 [Candidatus Gracilibacteria bacterium]|nr:hypothetical protein [Candidatus Gracilibacteria bacterium]